MKSKVVVFLMACLFLFIGTSYGQKSRFMFHQGKSLLIDPRYHTYEEVVAELDSIANAYPNITRMDSIGISTTDSTIIWALKVSDNPLIEEDEPAVLYNGIHHAEELLGAEICMYMINDLVTRYGIDSQVTAWVDSTEIWIVPIINPDGHEIVMTEIDTIWRKNTRDNNENDTFDLDYDGVDPNRNYDFNWDMGVSTNPGSEYYRGLYPFSELETQAIRDLSNDQYFIFANNYHSARTGQGEIIYYPWSWSGQHSPDHPAISQVADSMASLIINDAGTGTYVASAGPATMGGLARNWQYGVKQTFGFTVEVSTCCTPPGSLVNDICERNLVGAYYLIDRVYGSSITGCITDSTTGEPLEAEVRILEAYDPDLPSRLSDSTYGRYRRILVPDTYTVEVVKVGYAVVTIPDVVVFEDEPTILNVQLSAIPWIIYYSHIINDLPPGGNNNGELDPGETANMIVTLHNSGLRGLSDVHAVLRTTDPWLVITDSSGNFGDIPVDSNSNNSWDQFTVSVSLSTPPGHKVEFSLYITGDGGTYPYADTSNFSVVIGDPTPADPTGPDEYGYWAYDNTDTLYGHSPTYEWFEIAPPGPGSIISEITNEDADTITLDLPFTFKYYGEEYESIGVCSNGFLELGSSTYRFGANTGIPAVDGPRTMIAPFWDDLDPSEAGDIYQYYDDTEHCWIIEFYEVDHYGGPGDYETFQVILYDPAYYTTPTGDGEMVFQYYTVSDVTSNTVGIEDSTETIGMQWVYNDTYDPTAAPLVVSRAIKFTTCPPVTSPMPWVYFQDYVINDSAGNNNGIPDPGETVKLTVFLANNGDSSANNVETILRNSDPDITILDSIASFGNIPAGGQANNASDPYIFAVDSTIIDTIAAFTLLINANEGTYQTVAYFTIELGTIIGISDATHQLPKTYGLLQNYPNPMNTTTKIPYQLPRTEKVCLKVYNVAGQLVKTLVNEIKKPGYYTTYWDGEDENGRKSAGAVYFYRIQAGNYTSTKKMILLR